MEQNNLDNNIQEKLDLIEKKDNKNIVITVVLVVIILTLIIGIGVGIWLLFGNTDKTESSSNNETITTSNNTEKKSNNNTTETKKVNDIEITYTTKIVKEITDGNAKYICREQVPEITGLDKNAANKIEEYIKKYNSDVWKDIVSQNSDDAIKKILQGKDDYYESYEIGFTQSYKVIYLNSQVITFQTNFDGGIGGVSWATQSGITFNTKTGEVVKVEDIILSKTNYTNACKEYVYEELKKDSRYKEVITTHQNDYEKIINESIEKIDGYFTDDGIVCVQIPKYSIASGASGEFKYAVPYNLVSKYIKSEYDFSKDNNKASLIKENYIDNTKTPGTVSKTEANNNKGNNNKSQTSTESEAVQAIRKALKDKSWLKENVSIKEDWGGTKITDLDSQKHTFMVLRNDGNSAPIVIVYTATSPEEYSGSYKLFIVSYENGKVISTPITANSNHAGHCSMVVDANNKIAKYSYGHMNTGLNIYLKIYSNKVEELDKFEYEFTFDSNDTSKMIRENFVKDGKKVTEDEIKKIEAKYSNCKFYSIDTELTAANIDEFVK